MIRLLALLVLLGLVAAGFAWVADQPGDIEIVFRGVRYGMTPLVGFVGVIAAALVVSFALWLLRAIFTAPRRLSHAARQRRRRRGLAALSRGMAAAGAGDLRAAQRATALATKGLGEEPLTLMLRAQTAQLAGDRHAARESFARLAERPETRALGLRGLHVEARRAGDSEAAHHYALEAHRIAPAAWAGAAVLDHHASRQDWTQALATVEANAAQRLIDRPTADRQRAALKTAIALDLGDRDQAEALRLAREAADAAPDITPAVTLAARLLARRGDLRRAAKTIEAAWKSEPRPDLARVYVDLRPGDSASDRLVRAQALRRLAPDDAESLVCVAAAAAGARDFALARRMMASLVEGSATVRPTVRMCLLMADIEEAERGDAGLTREWLSRASRAPRGKAWIADGVISDVWAPVSPTTGKLDAFRWLTPPERLSAAEPWEPPADPAPPPAIEAAPPTPLFHAAPVEPAAAPSPPIEPAAAALVAAPGAPPPDLPSPAAATRRDEDDAATKLAAIRDAARKTPRRVDLAPIATAPDDPGPRPEP